MTSLCLFVGVLNLALIYGFHSEHHDHVDEGQSSESHDEEEGGDER